MSRTLREIREETQAKAKAFLEGLMMKGRCLDCGKIGKVSKITIQCIDCLGK